MNDYTQELMTAITKIADMCSVTETEVIRSLTSDLVLIAKGDTSDMALLKNIDECEPVEDDNTTVERFTPYAPYPFNVLEAAHKRTITDIAVEAEKNGYYYSKDSIIKGINMLKKEQGIIIRFKYYKKLTAKDITDYLNYTETRIEELEVVALSLLASPELDSYMRVPDTESEKKSQKKSK